MAKIDEASNHRAMWNCVESIIPLASMLREYDLTTLDTIPLESVYSDLHQIEKLLLRVIDTLNT